MDAERCVAAVLVALLAPAILGYQNAVLAADSTGEGSAGASIDFRIVVPVVLRIRTVSQVSELSIAESDVARGYVDTAMGTRLRVTTNSPSGVVVSLVFDPGLLARVDARLAGRTVHAPASAGAGAVRVGKLQDAPIDVGYRLYLAAGTRPGTYRWPVALSLSAGG